jgi:hypothetical protein
MKTVANSPEELRAAIARLRDDDVIDLYQDPETGVWEVRG